MFKEKILPSEFNTKLEEKFSTYIEFTTQCITGTYMSYYRIYKKFNIKTTFISGICIYLNMCYKSLILKDDPFVVENFKKMQNHSPNCLLNIIFKIAKVIIEKYDFTYLENQYINSIRNSIRNKIKDDIIDSCFFLAHECSGPKDISNEDPNKPFFEMNLRIDHNDNDQNPNSIKIGVVCFYCGKLSQKIKKCSRCKSIHYCDKNCQQKDWENHKKYCTRVE